MDYVKKYSQQPLVVGGIAFVVGLIIGLVILGWWLFPVQWTDGSPSDLTHDYQVEYMRMSIDSFAVNGDAALAAQRYSSLGEDAGQVYAEIAASPTGQSTEVIAAYGAVVGATGTAAVPPESGVPTSAVPTTAVPTEGEEESGGLGGLVPFLCGFGLLLLLAAAGGYLYYTRWMKPAPKSRPASPPPSPSTVPLGETIVEEDAPAERDVTAPPVGQFMANYNLGDELYDDSFSIDSKTGEFLGECGVGVSETVGVGEVQKVTAFEIWLFDKNDIQTVTKVLMSGYAFRDNEIRQRLSAKGEPVMVAPGGTATLETQTLYMLARIVDMGYGDGSMPPESYFNRFAIELSVWSK